jgi:hypothetical protein
MLFAGETGQQCGYRDRWSEEGLYLYTGEGQRGDMLFTHLERWGFWLSGLQTLKVKSPIINLTKQKEVAGRPSRSYQNHHDCSLLNSRSTTAGNILS